ncbi:hypothetical protein Barb6_00769 [Bacteroidales bacterium Barb6]|nr:hypothetical protein Barb6_00769 [Bacteroidales bacterium Barb6]
MGLKSLALSGLPRNIHYKWIFIIYLQLNLYQLKINTMRRFTKCTDKDFDVNVRNFNKNLNLYKDALGISAEVLDEVAAIENGWKAVFVKVADRKKCTSADIEAKNNYRKTTGSRLADLFDGYVRHNLALTGEMRFAFDLSDPHAAKRRIPPPADKPVLTVSRNAHLELNAVLSRATSERRHGKPEGVTSYEIWIQEGSEPVDEKKLTCYGRYTNTSEIFRFPFADIGRVVTFVARWVNPRGESGPWSDPVTISIG